MQAKLNLPKPVDGWIGNSQAIEDVRRRLEGISNTQLPVLISGETGTGKSVAANYLHQQNSGSNAPFISQCCKHWQGLDVADLMDECWHQAEGGTLYLRNIERLSATQAFSIKDYWLNSEQGINSVRLIAGYNPDNPQFDSEPQDNDFLHWLQYHCLVIRLPTLAERKDDLPFMISHYQKRYPELAKLSIHSDALEVLCHFAWPDNAKQLKRCLAKLAVLAPNEEVSKKVLLDNFPSMQKTSDLVVAFPMSADAKTPTRFESADTFPSSDFQHKPQARAMDESSQNQQKTCHMESHQYAKHDEANEGSQPDILGLHPALDKAIVYIQSNYKDPLTMHHLSAHACVSPSHLSFLFKRYLGMPFKQVLLRLRIEQAMHILRTQPNTHVTQVCDDVGFCDLSFFVRKFKAIVGVSPGAYRDQFDKRKKYFL